MAQCPRCNARMSVRTDDPHRRSIDHVLPQVRGGSNLLHGDTRNTVTICQACNGWRASCLHCWALVACVAAVARDTSETTRRVYRRWRLGHVRVLHEWRPAGRVVSRQHLGEVRLLVDHASDAARKAANAERVAIARAVDRIGLDEFAWPADTAAARVWNLATLGRRYRGAVSG